METRAAIQKAIQDEQQISIIYHGGSQPGASRDIIPSAIFDNKVRAVCLLSHKSKVFVIDKIQIADSNLVEATPNWTNGITFHEFTTIEEIHDATRDTLIGMGWHVNFDEQVISLHRCRKNGTPLKGCDVSISFETMTHDLFVNEDGELYEANHRKRQNPWTIRAKNRHHKSFKDPDNAASWFMAMVSEHKPVK